MPLQTGFGVLMVAAVLVPALVLAAASWWSRANVRAAVEARAERSVAILHENARRAFETQDALLTALEWTTRGMSWSAIAVDAQVAELARRLDNSAPGTSALGMIAPDGALVQITTRPFPPPPVNLADRDYVRVQSGPAPRPFVSEVLEGRLSGNVVFNYSRPRIGADGRPDGGLLWATFRVPELQRFYAATKDFPGDAILLVRTEDGMVLASDPPLPLRHVLPADGAAMAALREGTGFGPPGQTAEEAGRRYAARRVGEVPVAVIYGIHPDRIRTQWLREVAVMAPVAAIAAAALLWAAWGAAREATALTRERDALRLARDAAEQRERAEAVVRETQRMSVLGQVAAGVAHDFRNTVQAVVGGTVLAGHALDRGDGDGARAILRMMAEAAGRGGRLTDRMVEASRRAAGRTDAPDGLAARMEPEVALASAVPLLGSALVPRHVLRAEVAAELPAFVRGDRGEFEAALLNLVVNARDAQPEGGAVTLRATAEAVAGINPAGLAPGRYLRIEIEDRGMGMDAATLVRATEAFFTTKPGGQGTGLGLSTANAFARNAGRALTLASPGPGEGACVTIWLPEAPPGAG